MQEALLNQFNNAELVELDPLYAKNYRLLEQTTAAITVKTDNGKGQTDSTQEQLLVKLYVREHRRQLDSVLVDLLSEEDLFFQFRAEVTETDFRRIVEEQELEAQFKAFPQLLLNLLEELKKDSSRGAELEVLSDNKAQLVLLQRINNKDFNLLTLDLFREEEQVVRDMVAYRYSMLRAEIERMEGRVLDVREMLRIKNPYLLNTFDQF